jgi:hypothetical protein
VLARARLGKPEQRRVVALLVVVTEVGQPHPPVAVDGDRLGVLDLSPAHTRGADDVAGRDLDRVDDRLVTVVDRVREILVLRADDEAARLLDARVTHLADLLRVLAQRSGRDAHGDEQESEGQ